MIIRRGGGRLLRNDSEVQKKGRICCSGLMFSRQFLVNPTPLILNLSLYTLNDKSFPFPFSPLFFHLYFSSSFFSLSFFSNLLIYSFSVQSSSFLFFFFSHVFFSSFSFSFSLSIVLLYIYMVMLCNNLTLYALYVRHLDSQTWSSLNGSVSLDWFGLIFTFQLI